MILDAYSRRVIGWALDRTMEDSLTLTALRMALSRRVVEAGLVVWSKYSCGAFVYLSKPPSLERVTLRVLFVAQIWESEPSKTQTNASVEGATIRRYPCGDRPAAAHATIWPQDRGPLSLTSVSEVLAVQKEADVPGLYPRNPDRA